ncbi:hypothetical protein JCM19046_394 [Bacillus sp. JCM 19046]|uniref:Membrane protein YdjX (TVP38/TMEM64 family) n=1 Tax=Shouchella xiaoxiensis TaxID=766895 RepID=A0ABS2SSL3_9BACI|nr:TVP38/TMEM64 family protein [Shouchella xiaoxiensis]MBM7838502.1 putative membrane protein YdjX (TVP38/TMEM64 family) [Shouchella xiaoxiensis]GAF15990.1 hypothetical protein JCM19046_394 [Bacillus sp. JCM 19046]
MDELFNRALEVIEAAGWYAPVLFVLLHVLRPLLFLPVLLVTVAGGYVFGPIYGAIYSYIGLMGVSVSFYWIIGLMPKLHQKLARLKEKVFANRERMNTWQLLVLRVMPFMHFHVISFYVIEETRDFHHYVKKSAIINASPAVVYTAFGGLIHQLPLPGVLLLVGFLAILAFLVRTKNEQEQANEPQEKYL